MYRAYKKFNGRAQHLCGIVTGGREIINFTRSDNIKTVFKVADKKGVDHICVYWGITLVEEGEVVTVRGYRKNNIFLVDSILRNYELIE